MALYFYQGFSKDGKSTSGYLDASTVQGVREQLSKIGVFPTKIELSESQAARVPFYRRIFQRGISLKEKIFFTKQLAVLLKSGVPLVQALELLMQQTTGTLQTIVITLKDGIKEGRSLSDGLQKYPATFDSIYVQLVKAGEATGKLETILARLTDYLEKREEIRKKISGALRYPIIQLVVIVLVVVALLWAVVPQITKVFESMKGKIELPLPTRILIGMSDFFIHHFILIAAILIGIAVGYKVWSGTPSGAYTVDKIKLKLPLIGYFAKTGAVVQFSRTLGMLVEGGVNLAEALNIVVNIVDNKVLVTELEKAKENIIKQGKIAQYLKETELFPPLAIYLINTGEQSGQLDSMLLSVARTYEDDLTETADGLVSLLNPIMLLVMAVIVGFVILSVMMPIQEMQSLAEKMG